MARGAFEGGFEGGGGEGIQHQFILGMTDALLHSGRRDFEAFLMQNSAQVTM